MILQLFSPITQQKRGRTHHSHASSTPVTSPKRHGGTAASKSETPDHHAGPAYTYTAVDDNWSIHATAGNQEFSSSSTLLPIDDKPDQEHVPASQDGAATRDLPMFRRGDDFRGLGCWALDTSSHYYPSTPPTATPSANPQPQPSCPYHGPLLQLTNPRDHMQEAHLAFRVSLQPAQQEQQYVLFNDPYTGNLSTPRRCTCNASAELTGLCDDFMELSVEERQVGRGAS
jgi:hypothetical protein